MTAVAEPLTIEQRLDALSAQVADLTEMVARRDAERERWAELAREMTPIARSALDSVGRELDTIRNEVSPREVVLLLEDIARALPTLRAGIGQMAGLSDLAEEVSRLSGPAVQVLAERLGELDERGYFDFAQAGLGVVDRVVTSFTEDDVDALGDNIVLILNTVKEMTQPEIMTMLRRTVSVVREDAPAPAEPPSMFALLREMREPAVRRGLARVLDMLRSVSAEGTTVAQDR